MKKVLLYSGLAVFLAGTFFACQEDLLTPDAVGTAASVGKTLYANVVL